MVKLYQTLAESLTEPVLFDWDAMLMNGRRDLDNIGSYRTHVEPMQIVSGSDDNRKFHYEALPSKHVADIPAIF